MSPIRSFDGPFAFLHNDHPCDTMVDGLYCRSVTHAFWASRTDDAEARARIAACETAEEARQTGCLLPASEGWEAAQLEVMRDLLWQKFDPSALMLDCALVGTAARDLLFTGPGADTFWGICDGAGENHLGQLLKETRQRLRGVGHLPLGAVVRAASGENPAAVIRPFRPWSGPRWPDVYEAEWVTGDWEVRALLCQRPLPGLLPDHVCELQLVNGTHDGLRFIGIDARSPRGYEIEGAFTTDERERKHNPATKATEEYVGLRLKGPLTTRSLDEVLQHVSAALATAGH